MTRLRNVWLALSLLPALLFDVRQRRLFAEMRAFCRRLPGVLAAPLPQVLAALTPQTADLALPAAQVRRLADVAALLDRRSPLGVCLRRSLARYHYLRRAGLPVAVQFGARFVSGKPDREISGHAWLTLAGQPYFEDGENFRGFTVMYGYPASHK
jgi:Transglutaminase-like superfamily